MKKVSKRVWFHRARSLCWVALGIAAFATGWADAVWFVTAASIYANVASDWSASEAADDSVVLRELRALSAKVDG